MATNKFDSLDRNRVIREVEEYYNVKLEKAGRRSKWLQDESGRNWWILGGYGDYHGVPEDMMEAELRDPTAGMLIIAVRKLPDIELFSGPVEQLCENRHNLYRARNTTGDYQFITSVSRNDLKITGEKDVEIVRLKRIVSFSYSEEDKAQDRGLGKQRKERAVALNKVIQAGTAEELAHVEEALKARLRELQESAEGPEESDGQAAISSWSSAPGTPAPGS